MEIQLQNIQAITLGTNSWHPTKHILALGNKQGGRGLAPLGSYAPWVHSHTFVQLVKSPHTIQLQEVTRFQKWAENNAIIPTEFTLPYFQCAPISISTPTFVQKNDTGILQIKEVCDNTPTTPKRADGKYATVA